VVARRTQGSDYKSIATHLRRGYTACFPQRVSSMAEFTFQTEPQLQPAEFIDLLHRSTLAERRPVSEFKTITGMLTHADIIVTARAADGKLIGVSRAISDFSYCTYLSDLAVDVAVQRQGIGRELIRRTHHAAGLHTALILLAAPQAQDYYPHIGMRQHDSCWVTPRVSRPSSD
jgi:ribosomal protein S18 acetylase RimI-like enzyme